MHLLLKALSTVDSIETLSIETKLSTMSYYICIKGCNKCPSLIFFAVKANAFVTQVDSIETLGIKNYTRHNVTLHVHLGL